jgi:chemotaxis protein histidine kinase CheA
LAGETDALQAIADEFVRSLPARMATTDSAWAALNVPQPTTDALNDFYHQIHNMSGSSGTFGFMQFSQISRKILNILEPAIKGEAGLSAEMISAVGPVLDELKVEAKEPVQVEGWL